MTHPIDTRPEAIAALLEGVTPGPWVEFISDDGGKWTGWPASIECTSIVDKTIVRPGGHWPYEWDAKTSCDEACANARFIAAARDLVPALAAEIARLTAERDEARALLAATLSRLADDMDYGWSYIAGNHIRAMTPADASTALAARDAAMRNEGRRQAVSDFDGADWYWRTMDPDDSGDSPEEAINSGMVGALCVCEIASSFRGPTRYGFVAKVVDPESDDEEFLHFATQQEAIDAAKERIAILAALEPEGGE